MTAIQLQDKARELDAIVVDGMICRVVPTHIEDIKAGDTILWRDGHAKTVGLRNMRISKSKGRTLFGDCYQLGYEPVQKLIIYNGKNFM